MTNALSNWVFRVVVFGEETFKHRDGSEGKCKYVYDIIETDDLHYARKYRRNAAECGLETLLEWIDKNDLAYRV